MPINLSKPSEHVTLVTIERPEALKNAPDRNNDFFIVPKVGE